MASGNFHGVITPVPTIVQESGRFDQEGMGVLLDRLVRSSVNGLLILGSAGEFFQIQAAERKAIAAYSVARVGHRIPVLIGIADCATEQVIELGHHAAQIGADGVVVVNPYYAPLSTERLYLHYRRIAQAVSVPVLLYNFPAMTGQDLALDLVTKLALDCPNIVGIKDTIDCASHIRQFIIDVKSVRPDFAVFAGFDEYIMHTLLLGGDGAIPASSNFAPELTCGLYKAFRTGDFSQVADLTRRLGVLSAMYALDTPFFGVVKEAIRMTGSDLSGAVVAPATVPDEETRQKLRKILVRAGVLPR
ncbi:MAG: dihydrodipicolinate synthase family protein [Acetobacteraceae bacterium]|nr:dihydrodipicolinate synthase family protein [Acetobacteraceae bacterium]